MEFQVDIDDRFTGKCTNICNLDAIDKVYHALDANHRKAFRCSCFRKFYHMRKMQLSGQLIHGLALRILKSENKNELWFGVGNNKAARFSFDEFTLITGLNPEDEALYKDQIPMTNRLAETYFDGANKIVPAQLKLAFDNCEEMEDKYKLGLVYVYESILRSKHYKTSIDMLVLNIVDDKHLFNQYPWGRRCYNSTIHAFLRSWGEIVTKLKEGGKSVYNYSLEGFPYALQVWAYEALSAIGNDFATRKSVNKVPRMVNWTATGVFDQNEISSVLDHPQLEVRVRLMATEVEKEQRYMQLFEPFSRRPDPVLDAYINEDGGDDMADNEEGDDNVYLLQTDKVSPLRHDEDPGYGRDQISSPGQVPSSAPDAAHENPQASQRAPHVHQPSHDLDFILEGLRMHIDQIVVPRLFNYMDRMEERLRSDILLVNDKVDSMMESMQRYNQTNGNNQYWEDGPNDGWGGGGRCEREGGEGYGGGEGKVMEEASPRDTEDGEVRDMEEDEVGEIEEAEIRETDVAAPGIQRRQR